MVRVIERREDAPPDELVFEFKVYLSHKDGQTVLGYVRPTDYVVAQGRAIFMGTEHGIPAKEAFLTAIELCEEYSVSYLWVHDPLGFFPARVRPKRETS